MSKGHFSKDFISKGHYSEDFDSEESFILNFGLMTLRDENFSK